MQYLGKYYRKHKKMFLREFYLEKYVIVLSKRFSYADGTIKLRKHALIFLLRKTILDIK